MTTVMMAVLMIMYRNENRETAADADQRYGKDDAGENLFHGGLRVISHTRITQLPLVGTTSICVEL